MKTYSFFDSATGMLRPFTIHCADYDLKLNTPEGCTAIEGKHDHLCRRVDLQTRAIVSYQPPQPDADHEWNPATERWERRADVIAREARRAANLARIDQLERQQLRPLRELQINPNNAEARRRLDEIEQEIARVRAKL